MKFILLNLIFFFSLLRSEAQSCTTDAGSDAEMCSGSSITIGSLPVSGFTYSWLPSTGLNNSASSNPTLTLTNVSGSAAIFSYTLTATEDSSGCSVQDIINVTVFPIPAITVNSPTICFGQTAILTASGGTTYSWSNGSTNNPLTISPSGNTSFTVTGTSNGCSNTAVANVIVNTIPTITVNSPTICAGQTATLTALGGIFYSWSAGSTNNPLSVSPSGNTSYTVTGTSNGCSNTAVANVIVYSPNYYR
jgi:hypothetical protein